MTNLLKCRHPHDIDHLHYQTLRATVVLSQRWYYWYWLKELGLIFIKILGNSSPGAPGRETNAIGNHQPVSLLASFIIITICHLLHKYKQHHGRTQTRLLSTVGIVVAER